MIKVKIEKLVHGGQGLGSLEDGKKVFVWNALPDEEVEIELRKSKKSFVEAVAVNVIKPNSNRVEPREQGYLATSPWQIMDPSYESRQKAVIARESFEREGINLPAFQTQTDGKYYNYRNKIEFSFYGDDAGLHYAFYNRGTHQKQIVAESALALPAINTAAKHFLIELNKLDVRAGDLKSLILRSDQAGLVVGALFVKANKFPTIKIPGSLKGLRIYHSNPRSPASVPTKLLKVYGDDSLYDEVLGTRLQYDVIGFFQVNLPVYELAVKRIEELALDMPKIDFYSGVGSIGIPLDNTEMLVELDINSANMAKLNIGAKPINLECTSSEKALQYIESDKCLIVDPPRAGLHKHVVERILEVKPRQIIYLSCNPSTQARDVGMLIAGGYKVDSFDCYNFFPRTPHIETLISLKV